MKKKKKKKKKKGFLHWFGDVLFSLFTTRTKEEKNMIEGVGGWRWRLVNMVGGLRAS